MIIKKMILLKSASSIGLRNILRLNSLPFSSNVDTEYYCNYNNAQEIKNNISMRKGVGDVDLVLETYNALKRTSVTDSSHSILKSKLFKELHRLPNRTHPLICEYNDVPKIVCELNKKRDFVDHVPLEFSEITRRLNLLRTQKLGNACGHKAYYFLHDLSELEEALIKYTVSFLLQEGFNLVSVPDILPSNVLESCGMIVNNERTQIYTLDPVHHGPDLCLSGTAEMSLAGLLMNSKHKEADLPLKLAAVSRCYRAEVSTAAEEKGIYRVHQFTKVEMFAVTTPENSDEMLEYIRGLQEKLFSPLGFHMRVLDMPPSELGAPAYRKYDIEAWMPGRNSYGEVSSCSNCTDYQSRRLDITCCDDSEVRFAHTLNGTACAVPRMLIALLETHQHPRGKIYVPDVLQPFMGGKKFIGKNSFVPGLSLLLK